MTSMLGRHVARLGGPSAEGSADGRRAGLKVSSWGFCLVGLAMLGLGLTASFASWSWTALSQTQQTAQQAAQQAEQQEQQLQQQQQQQQQQQETLEFLSSWKVCANCKSAMVRIGDPLGGAAPPPYIDPSGGNHMNDGGYLMCADTAADTRVALSIGINSWDGWGIHMSDKFKTQIFQYDCTNDKAPTCPSDRSCQMTFHNLCIDDGQGAFAPDRMRSLGEMVRLHASSDDNDLILKIDCENCEWGVFENADLELLGRFKVIVAEFHDMRVEHSRKLAIMRKLLSLFHVVHTHECNFARIIDFDAYRIPNVFEVTLVRKSLVDPVSCHGSPYFLTLDLPDKLGKRDVGAAAMILP